MSKTQSSPMDSQRSPANHIIDAFCERTIVTSNENYKRLPKQLPETVGIEDPNSEVAQILCRSSTQNQCVAGSHENPLGRVNKGTSQIDSDRDLSIAGQSSEHRKIGCCQLAIIAAAKVSACDRDRLRYI